MQYPVTMTRKRKILFNFWPAESEKPLVKAEDKQEIKVTGGQPRSKRLAWKQIILGEMENFVLILEVMAYESREEKSGVPLQERVGG